MFFLDEIFYHFRNVADQGPYTVHVECSVSNWTQWHVQSNPVNKNTEGGTESIIEFRENVRAFFPHRLRVVPIFPQGWRARETRARVKINLRDKRRHAAAFSRVGWFSRALGFRSLYYPWGKMGTSTRSVLSPRKKQTVCLWCPY